MTKLAEARACVERVIALLGRPTLEALEQSDAELAAAVGLIQQLNNTEPMPDHEQEIRALRRDLRRATALLRQAWTFRAGAAQSGYSRSGELTVDTASLSRVALEG